MNFVVPIFIMMYRKSARYSVKHKMLRHSLNSEPHAREKPHVSRQHYTVERIPMKHPYLASKVISQIVSLKSSACCTHHQSLFAVASVFLASHFPNADDYLCASSPFANADLVHSHVQFASPVASIQSPGLHGLNLDYGSGGWLYLV